MDINGTLNVKGDYHIMDSAYLRMDNTNDAVNVSNNFIMESNMPTSSNSGCNYFGTGTISIGGDFYQRNNKSVDSKKNFQSSGTVIRFTGNTAHTIYSESSLTQIGTIMLNKSGKVTFKGSLVGLENVENCTFNSDGKMVGISGNTIDATYAGKEKITIADSSNSTATINVNVTDYVVGDVNCDGQVTVADVVLLQKWLLANPSAFLPCWETADLCEDNRIDVFDLCLLKRKLIYG